MSKRTKPAPSPEEERARRALAAAWDKKREREKLSQADGAEACDWSPGNFSHYLSGQNRLNFNAVKKLCQYLGENPRDVYPEMFVNVELPAELEKPTRARPRLSADAIEIGKLVDSLGGAARRKSLKQFVTEYVNGQHAIDALKAKGRIAKPHA